MGKKRSIILAVIAILFIFIGFVVIRSSSGVGFLIRWILMILGGLILVILIPYLAYKQFKTHPIFSSFLFGLIISTIVSFVVIGVASASHWHMRSASIFLGFVLSFFVFIVVGGLSVVVGWIIYKRRKQKMFSQSQRSP